MIFTVGRRSIYDQGLEHGPDFKKLGRCELQYGYEGGSVWRTKQEAESYLEREMDRGRLFDYGVYGVLADWDTETMQLGDEPFRRLLETRQIVRAE